MAIVDREARKQKKLRKAVKPGEVLHKKEKRKRGLLFRIFRTGVALVLCAILVTAAINAYMIYTTRSKILTLEEVDGLGMECVMVLGAGLHWDGTPGIMLTDRLMVGIDAYKKGAAHKLLMSGDHGQIEYDEVNAMKTFAMEQDIPSYDVFMDHAGFSTYESMYRAKSIFHVKEIVIVTQRYHLYRAIYNAERMGMKAYGVSSALQEYAGQRYFDFREYFARVKDFFWGIVKPQPTYLGQVIPITGDGNLTND